jgi:hypothetical protein
MTSSPQNVQHVVLAKPSSALGEQNLNQAGFISAVNQVNAFL